MEGISYWWTGGWRGRRRSNRVERKERKRKRTDSGKGFLTSSHYRRKTGSVFWLKSIVTGFTVYCFIIRYLHSKSNTCSSGHNRHGNRLANISQVKEISQGALRDLLLFLLLLLGCFPAELLLPSLSFRSASLLPSAYSFADANLHPANYQLGSCFWLWASSYTVCQHKKPQRKAAEGKQCFNDCMTRSMRLGQHRSLFRPTIINVHLFMFGSDSKYQECDAEFHCSSLCELVSTFSSSLS